MESLKQKFLQKVEKTSGCWLWTGTKRNKNRDSYGVVSFNGKKIDTHRVSYMLFKGDISGGLYVCHTCDVRLCVNPDHLWLGTHSDNMKDAYRKKRIKIPDGGKFKDGNKPLNRVKSEETVKEIKEALKGMSIFKVATKFKVKESFVKDISSGRTYKNV